MLRGVKSPWHGTAATGPGSCRAEPRPLAAHLGLGTGGARLGELGVEPVERRRPVEDGAGGRTGRLAVQAGLQPAERADEGRQAGEVPRHLVDRGFEAGVGEDEPVRPARPGGQHAGRGEALAVGPAVPRRLGRGLLGVGGDPHDQPARPQRIGRPGEAASEGVGAEAERKGLRCTGKGDRPPEGLGSGAGGHRRRVVGRGRRPFGAAATWLTKRLLTPSVAGSPAEPRRSGLSDAATGVGPARVSVRIAERVNEFTVETVNN